MKTYFGYIRVSTAKQGEGVSLIEQKAAIERYAQKGSLSLIEWFEERETAAKRGRPVFSQMLTLLRRGKAVGVVIHKIDRSARNLKDWADLGELIDSGVEVHFAADALDLNSRGGRLSADIQAVVAADYIRNLREETRKGFYGRLKQGLYPLGAPTGYLDCGGGNAKALDPERAPLIRFAFEAYASGTHTLATLSTELFRRGLRTRSGKRIGRSSLSKLLNNPFYAGVIRLRTTRETFVGIHPRIIAPWLFEAVQARLQGKLVDRVQRHDFLFRRLLQCATCAFSLIGSRKKGRVYYRCQTRTCPTTSVREDAVEEQLSHLLEAIEFSHDEIREAREMISRTMQDAMSDTRVHQEAVDLQISGVQARADRLTDAFVDGALPKEAYLERRERLQLELASLEEAKQEIGDGWPELRRRADRILELLERLNYAFELAPPAKKRLLLEELTSNRTARGKNVVFTLWNPFQALLNTHFVHSGDPHRDKPRTLALWYQGEIAKLEAERRKREEERKQRPQPPPGPPQRNAI